MVGDGHDLLLLWPLACVVSTAHTHTKHEMAQHQVFVVWQGCWWWLAIVLVCVVCSLCQCTVLHHMWLCHAHCLLCLACFVCSACSHCVVCVWFEQQQQTHTPGLQQAHRVVVCSLHIAPTSLLSMCFINHPSSLLLVCLLLVW